MIKKELKTYRDIKIINMDQRELIVFLYESALRLMEAGKDKIGDNDIPGTHDHLDRARNIFIHLLATLNLEAGGEFAKKLSALYSYFVEKITMANTLHKAEELDEIMPMVKEIKEAWEKMEFNDPGKSSKGIKNQDSQLISMEA